MKLECISFVKYMIQAAKCFCWSPANRTEVPWKNMSLITLDSVMGLVCILLSEDLDTIGRLLFNKQSESLAGCSFVCIKNCCTIWLSGGESTKSNPDKFHYEFKWVISCQSNISLWMETQSWIFLPFFHLSPADKHGLLLCDTWVAVGGRCNVFIHSLVSSQTGTEFHYSGIKEN